MPRWIRCSVTPWEPRAARFEATHKSDWCMEISLDDLLEHAVMHPLRHGFQLEELLEGRGKG